MPDEQPHSLMNLQDIVGLSKPCVTLIEKVSEALGGFYRPTQIIKIAKAEAEAAVIRSHSEIQIQDINRRALLRFEEEQAQYQMNMEATLKKALPLVHEEAKPENINKDWLTYFFEKSRLISDDEMQNVWAQILSGEANQPGAFSRRTLAFIGDMNHKEAKHFTILGGFVCYFAQLPLLMVYNHNDPIYQSHGLTHQVLIHLESLNLIARHPEGFVQRGFPQQTHISYFDENLVLQLSPASQAEFVTGKAMLTALGTELLPICGRQKVDGFMNYLLTQWNVTKGTAPSPSET